MSVPLVRPGEFIVRINLTFNFPRRVFPTPLQSAVDAFRVKRCAPELFVARFRRRQFVCRAIPFCRITGIIDQNCHSAAWICAKGLDQSDAFIYRDSSSSSFLDINDCAASIIFSSAGIFMRVIWLSLWILKFIAKRTARLEQKQYLMVHVF